MLSLARLLRGYGWRTPRARRQPAKGRHSLRLRIEPLEDRLLLSAWKFLVYGDSRGSGSGDDAVNNQIVSELARATVAEQPAFVLCPGDLVNSGSLAAFQLWRNGNASYDNMQPVYAAGIPVYPVIGNHDASDPNAFISVFGPDLPDNGPSGETNRTYSLTYDNALILGLDTYVNPNQVNQPWIDAQLAARNPAVTPHVFAFGHEPAFKANHTDNLDDYPSQRDAFWNSLKAAGGRTYFAGHDHFYDHAQIGDGDGNPGNDLHQFIVGTAGAPFYTSSAYDGVNTTWTPTNVYHEEQYGYLLVTVDGPTVTTTWKHRTGPDTFAATADVSSYSISTANRHFTALSAAPDHIPGGETTVSYTIANGGGDALAAFDVNIVLSDNDVIGDSDDVVVATRTCPGLAGQASFSDSFLLTLPASARQTMYNWAKRDDAPVLPLPHVSASCDYLGIVVAPASAAAETSELNNASQGKGVDRDDVTCFPWDNNSSGQITPTDAIFIINRIGQTNPDRRADPDGSGTITPTDAIGVINRLGYQRNLGVDESTSLTGVSSLAATTDTQAPATTVTATPVLHELDSAPGLVLGEQFDVEFHFTDVRGTPQAVFSGYADVNFDPAKFRVDSINYGSDYASGHTGTINNATGLVDEVGATDGLSPPPSDIAFTLRMTAIGSGVSALGADAGEDAMSQIVVFGLDDDQRANTNFGSLQLTVRPPGDGLSVYDPVSSVWYVRNSATWGDPNAVFGFGSPGAGWQPVFGDWNGDGKDTAGLYDPATSTWYLSNGTSSTDVVMAYGAPGAGWKPVVGDWDGDGFDTPGLYDPKASVWYLTNSLHGGNAEIVFGYGSPDAGWIPVVGDWNGDRKDTIGLYDPASSVWYLSDSNSSASPTAIFGYGPPDGGWNPLAGDWNGDGKDSVGLYDAPASVWYFTNANQAGNAEAIVGFGAPDSGWRNARGSSNLLTQIVDDGPSAGCQISGEWTSIAGMGFRGDSCRSNPGTGADTVRWDFWVLPGQYTVAATWSPAADQALTAPLHVSDGSTPLAIVNVDQQVLPQDFIDEGVGWKTLGTFDVTGNHLVVTLSDDTLLPVDADAIRIERVSAPR